MFGKILISGEIELLTGMHIGTGGEFAAIGAIDSPVVRDVITTKPIIPGSTLKGKLRSILAKEFSLKNANKADDDCEEIKRLFGDKNRPSRIIFTDMTIKNADELEKINIYTPTEVKFENTINRLTGVANPRQIERVIRGCIFGMEIIYNIDEEEEIEEDLKMLVEGFKLLKYDYLGGHGSRGYGKVKLNKLIAECVVGEVDDKLINKLNAMLKDVK